MTHYTRMMVSLLALVVVAGCSSDDTFKEETRSPEELYNLAQDSLKERDFGDAVKLFETLEREYPFSEWSRNARLMTAYAHYERNQYEDALIALDSYKKLYPAHESIAYAYFLTALSYYEQITDTRRDQEITEKAKKALTDVVKRFPELDYASDARIKLDLVEDHLAGKHMEVGRYYQKQQKYVAAINRYRDVVNNYQTTNHAPEALHRLVECYLALGLADDAKRAAAVLGYNYPGSQWYADSYVLITGDTSVRKAQELDWWDEVKDTMKSLL